MRLMDFPRPKYDNGLGIHWSASIYHPTGSELAFWIDELQAMGIKWVKLLDDGGCSSLEVCEKLLEADIMPIVRMWREKPNPGHLNGRQVEAVRRLVAEGVRYFETNNEPDLAAEWRVGSVPADWLDTVATNFIWDADTVLGLGGLPALPAVGPGSKDNLLQVVVQKGRRDLFDKGVWLAIHNYTLNHPPEYPDDEVNQHGRALTPREYADLARWALSGRSYDEILAAGVALSEEDYYKFDNWAWDWRSLSMVNQIRALNANPGHTVLDDPNCFCSWEVAGKVVEATLGFHLPVISTEGGPVVGWGDDNRYAKVSPETHRAWQLEIARFLEEQAPEWYFACCTWLIAANRMGSMNPTWDQMAWYTHAWDLQFGLQGQLPIVQALKDRNTGDGVIEGVIRTAAGRPVEGLSLRLQLGDRDVKGGRSGSGGVFRFRALRPGRYNLSVAGYGLVQQGIELGSGEALPLHLWLPAASAGVVEAHVADYSGAAVAGLTVLLRDSDGAERAQVSDGQGTARFEGLAAGLYRVKSRDAAAGGIYVDGWGTTVVDLTVSMPSRFRYAVTSKQLLSPEETGNRRAFFGTVYGADGSPQNGVAVEMSWKSQNPADRCPRVLSGADPFRPAGYYEFLHTLGEFELRVVHAEWESEVADGLVTDSVPGREGMPISYRVDFRLVPLDAGGSSALVDGRVPGIGAAQEIRLYSDGEGRSTVPDGEGRFAFEELVPGMYILEAVGLGTLASEIELGAGDAFHLNLPMLGVLEGQARGSEPAAVARLVSECWNLTRSVRLDREGVFRFGRLPAGPYLLEVAGQSLSGLWVAGSGTQTLFVIEGKKPAAGRVVGRVLSDRGEPLKDAILELMLGDVSVARVAADANGAFVFGDLEAGEYGLMVQGSDTGLVVQVDGMTATTVGDIILAPPTKPRFFGRYFLFGAGGDEASRAMLLVALDAVRRAGAAGGYALSEALQAGQVVILGDETGVSLEDEMLLREHGCDVTRLAGDAYAIGRALAGGRD